MKWTELFFLPMMLFALHPERVAVVAVIFGLGYAVLRLKSSCRAWPLLVAACVWGLWVPWEMYATAMEFNIRVDLLVLYPILLAVSAWALIDAIRPRSPASLGSQRN